MGASTSSTCVLLLFSLSLSLLISSCSSHSTTLKGIDVGNPVIDVSPSPIAGFSSTRGSKDVLLCERIRVSGLSRLKLGSYASSFRVHFGSISCNS
ncbi:hypothetical protein L1049_009432 [Liquidambar formosana]|uniref:Uncharacterized protein n=1 Tax=Liquidambar formosana TaxID=63359 RepID=A0AAP0SC73_LIQFO